MANKKLVLSYPHPNPNQSTGAQPLYRVEQVVQAMEPRPGQMLGYSEVRDQYVAAPRWTVVINPVKS